MVWHILISGSYLRGVCLEKKDLRAKQDKTTNPCVNNEQALDLAPYSVQNRFPFIQLAIGHTSVSLQAL